MRVLIARLLVQHITLGRHLLILAAMTLRRSHEADAAVAVAVFVVVPADKIAHLTASGVQICKAILGPLRAVFQGSRHGGCADCRGWQTTQSLRARRPALGTQRRSAAAHAGPAPRLLCRPRCAPSSVGAAGFELCQQLIQAIRQGRRFRQHKADPRTDHSLDQVESSGCLTADSLMYKFINLCISSFEGSDSKYSLAIRFDLLLR
jgi:hypothetical protein